MAACGSSPVGGGRSVRGDLCHCGKCKKKLRRPLLLTCFHSHCTECVEDLIKDARGRPFKCPTCEKAVTVRGENVFAETLMQILWPGKIAQRCQVCFALDKDTESTHVCLDCPPPYHYCGDCMKMHTLFSNSKSHRLVSSSDFIDGGSKHLQDLPKKTCSCNSSEVVDVVCRVCKEHLCRTCGMIEKCPKGKTGSENHVAENKGAIAKRSRSAIQCEIEDFRKKIAKVKSREKSSKKKMNKKGKEAVKSYSALDDEKMRLQLNIEQVKQQLVTTNKEKSQPFLTQLSILSAARDANLQSEKMAQRALDYTPDDHMETALKEVKAMPRLSPSGQNLVEDIVTFAGADMNLLKHVMGSVVCNRIISSFPGGVPESACCAITLPSGEEVIMEAAMGKGLHMIDHTGKRTKLFDIHVKGVCVCLTQKLMYLSAIHSNGDSCILVYDLTKEWKEDPKVVNVSDNRRVAVSEFSGKLALINLGAVIQICKPGGEVYFEIKREPSEFVDYLAWGSNDSVLFYVSALRAAVAGTPTHRVGCMSVSPVSSIRWRRPFDCATTVTYQTGAVYVTTVRQVLLLAPTSGCVLRIIECTQSPKAVRMLKNGVLELISYGC